MSSTHFACVHMSQIDFEHFLFHRCSERTPLLSWWVSLWQSLLLWLFFGLHQFHFGLQWTIWLLFQCIRWRRMWYVSYTYWWLYYKHVFATLNVSYCTDAYVDILNATNKKLFFQNCSNKRITPNTELSSEMYYIYYYLLKLWCCPSSLPFVDLYYVQIVKS